LVTDRAVERAVAGQPATIQLDREVDTSRGCVLTTDDQIQVTDMFSATLLWMDDTSLVPGRNYFVKIGTKVLPGTVMAVKHKIDIHTGGQIPANQIYKNEIARCDIAVSEDIVFDAFDRT